MRKIYLAGALLLAMLVFFYLSLQYGIVHLDNSVISLIGKRDSTEALTVWQVRLPRALGAMAIGAALGVAGGLAQAIFRNPLAEPTLIGLSSGATLGSIACISTGIAAYGSWANVCGAVLFALISALLIQSLAPKKGNAFLLIGLAFSSMVIALAGLLISISSKPGVQSLAFWNFGSLTLLTTSTLVVIAPFIILGLITTVLISPRLDAYSLGESSSHYLGVNPRNIRAISIIAMALLVGSSVSAVGAIAFLGLLVPHIVRALFGPSHRRMLGMSALVGATLLLIADFSARSIAQPHEIPLGLLTSLIGAPVLIYLIHFKSAQWVNHD